MTMRDIIKLTLVSAILCVVLSFTSITFRWHVSDHGVDGWYQYSHRSGIERGSIFITTVDMVWEEMEGLHITLHGFEVAPLYFRGGWWDGGGCGVSLLVVVPLMTAGVFLIFRIGRKWRRSEAPCGSECLNR